MMVQLSLLNSDRNGERIRLAECLLISRHRGSRVFPPWGNWGIRWTLQGPGRWRFQHQTRMDSSHFCLAHSVLSLFLWKLEGLTWCLCSDSLAEGECVWLPVWQQMQPQYLWLFQNCQCWVHHQLCWSVAWPWVMRPLFFYSNLYTLKESYQVTLQVFSIQAKIILFLHPSFQKIHSRFLLLQNNWN